MALGSGYELATDVQFREVSNFTTPPRAGRVTAVEGNGQVRVETDDPDGGDVLAWPLNGFTYAVNDVVYVIFAVNSPDSAIVIGSLAPLPTLEVGDPLIAGVIQARGSGGLRLQDDGGNLGIFVQDATGFVGFQTATPGYPIDIKRSNLASHMHFSGTNADSGGYFTSAFDSNFFMSGGASYNGSNWIAKAVTASIYGVQVGRHEWQVNTGLTPGGSFTPGQAMALDAIGLALGNFITPRGKLHAHDGTGGMMFVTKTAINATAQTIIPDGSGDVVNGLWFLSVVQPSSGSVFMTGNGIAPNSSIDIYSSGANTLNLRVNSNGSVDVRRTGGSLTYSVALFLLWL